MDTYTGADLRAKRTRAGIKVYVLAAQMGKHSSRVSQIEALAQVPRESADAYLTALGALLVRNAA